MSNTEYRNGYKFVDELCGKYGNKNGLQVAEHYLLASAATKNRKPEDAEEEVIFCKEVEEEIEKRLPKESGLTNVNQNIIEATLVYSRLIHEDKLNDTDSSLIFDSICVFATRFENRYANENWGEVEEVTGKNYFDTVAEEAEKYLLRKYGKEN